MYSYVFISMTVKIDFADVENTAIEMRPIRKFAEWTFNVIVQHSFDNDLNYELKILLRFSKSIKPRMWTLCSEKKEQRDAHSASQLF